MDSAWTTTREGEHYTALASYHHHGGGTLRRRRNLRSSTTTTIRDRTNGIIRSTTTTKRLPTCAEGLVVDLVADENDDEDVLCTGLLLRDDLVLAERACVQSARAAWVWQAPPPSPLGDEGDPSQTRLTRQKRVLRSTSMTKTSSSPQEHDQSTLLAVAALDAPAQEDMSPQSGYPRHRAFVLDPNHRKTSDLLWDASTRILEFHEDHQHHDDDRSVHVACLEGNLPVIALPSSSSSTAQNGARRTVAAAYPPDAFARMLWYPRDQGAAHFTNAGGEHWWSPKRDKKALVEELFSRIPLYASSDTGHALDILRAGGEGDKKYAYYLEGEDPKFRNASTLWKMYKVWTAETPFSGEPFFQWFDYGSGRTATYGKHSRGEIEEDYCPAMNDTERAKAVVIPHVDHDEDRVVLRYESADLPVEGGEMLFVWGLDDRIYVHANEGTHFHHVCFFRSRPVKMAGEIVVGKHGALLEVWNDSGHYKPTDRHLREFYRHLRATLPDMTPTMVAWKSEHTKMTAQQWTRFFSAKQ